MKRIIGKTINGIDYHVLYQKVGAYTYREVLIPKVTIYEFELIWQNKQPEKIRYTDLEKLNWIIIF